LSETGLRDERQGLEDWVRASEEITLAVCLNLAPRVATLKMLMALSDALPGLQNSCLYDAHMACLRGYTVGIKWNQRSVNRGMIYRMWNLLG
jgi:hypothetical protein